MPLNLAAVSSVVADSLALVGVDCTIDGVATKALISDLTDAKSYLQENMKSVVVPKPFAVNRGSTIVLSDGRIGLVYTVPNDDQVVYSFRAMICNAKLDVIGDVVTFAPNGDELSRIPGTLASLDGVMERLSAGLRQTELGLVRQTLIRFYTFPSFKPELGVRVSMKGIEFKVTDVDDLEDGILILMLESV